MNIVLNLDNTRTVNNFNWYPLQNNAKNVFIWDINKKVKGENEPVIYRFVLLHSEAGKVTVYIGEGGSLRGPANNPLCSQWRNPSGRRVREKNKTYIEQYIQNNDSNGWTEILLNTNPVVNLSNKGERNFFEKLLIGSYYQEYKRLKQDFEGIPNFLNKP